MPDIINLLPEHIANQIAAGEVVQRPASVVKELLENSIDAKSKTIKLIVKNAGKQLIQVIDDGIGMSETDARMCFERHATSKIRELDDLYRINTLGFRGEAMASIAAVAQVEMKTRKTDIPHGTHLVIEGSEVKLHEACSCQEGTSISVKNLFYNVPARRNFLKSGQIELKHIIEEFLRVALPNPDISMYLFNEEEEVFHLRPGTLKQRIVSVFGKKYEETLIPINEKSDIVNLHGFVGKPEHARKSRGEQYFFANNRYIRSSYLHHAIVNAYEDLLQADAHPFYVLFLELAPAKMDINVHPTKTEIKFTDEKAIYAMLRTIVRRALSHYNIAPSLSFDENEPFKQAVAQAELGQGRLPLSTGPNLLRPDPLRQKATPGEWEELYKILSEANQQPATIEPEEELISAEPAQVKQVLQLHQKYIVTTIKSGLMIIHQQLAHERILFEKYLERLNKAGTPSQRLLFPEIINLNQQDCALLSEILPEIRAIGFELEEFGKNSFIVNGIPADIPTEQHIIEQMLEEYKKEIPSGSVNRRESVALSLARRTGIQAGSSLTLEEMTRLIDELFGSSMPYFAPDGKPAIITIATEELDRKFKKN